MSQCFFNEGILSKKTVREITKQDLNKIDILGAKMISEAMPKLSTNTPLSADYMHRIQVKLNWIKSSIEKIENSGKGKIEFYVTINKDEKLKKYIKKENDLIGFKISDNGSIIICTDKIILKK